MTAYTDFHYSPTGSGVISGSQVLEQTEQGINGLGQYVQDNISGAIDTANQALTIAQTANTNATTALNTANSFSDAITTANQTANNALTTAQSAQSTANAASSLATTANNNATSALNAANTATSNVNTLTSTVNGLGNRMTAAENAISANAGNITTLQNNLATTNANVTAAANAASSAQATATSAQATATSTKNAAYVLRYTGTTITSGGTIAYADIDNTDNIKAGDKIIDATGAIYEIASVDIANETVTVSASEIINLAVLPDLFNSANTWTGNNTFTGRTSYVGIYDKFQTTAFDVRTDPESTRGGDIFRFWSGTGATYGDYLGGMSFYQSTDGSLTLQLICFGYPQTGNSTQKRINFRSARDGTSDFYPVQNNSINLGTSSLKWKSLNGINPGALSLPNTPGGTGTENVNYYDLSGNITIRDGSGGNIFTASCDGWIAIGTFASWLQVSNNTLQIATTGNPGADGFAQVFLPVRKGNSIKVLINQTKTQSQSFKLLPCEGNV